MAPRMKCVVLLLSHFEMKCRLVSQTVPRLPPQAVWESAVENPWLEYPREEQQPFGPTSVQP